MRRRLNEQRDVDFLKPPRSARWLRFSIGGMLLLTFLMACLFAYWAYLEQPLIVQDAAVNAIRARIDAVKPRYYPEQPLETKVTSVPWFGKEKHIEVLTKADFSAKVDNGQDFDVYHIVLDDHDLRSLGKCSKLRYLDLDSSVITDDGLKHLQNLRELEYLDLSRTQVTGPGLQHVARLPKLETLILEGLTVSGEAIAVLGRSPSLRHLSGLSVHLGDDDWSTLVANPELTSIKFDALTLNRLSLTRDDRLRGIEIKDLTVKELMIADAPNLAALSIRKGDIQKVEIRDVPRLVSIFIGAKSPTEVFHVENLPTLNRLHFFNRARGLSIRDCAKLEGLELAGFDNQQNAFSGLPSLEHLAVYHPSVSNQVFREILQSKELRELWMDVGYDGSTLSGLGTLVKLERLTVGSAILSDEIMTEIAKLPVLKALIFDKLDTAALDFGDFLARCSQLESIAVRDSSLGDVRIRSHPTLKRFRSSNSVMGCFEASGAPALLSVRHLGLDVKSIKLDHLPSLYDVEFWLRPGAVVNEIRIDSLPRAREIEFASVRTSQTEAGSPAARIPAEMLVPGASFPLMKPGGFSTNGCVLVEQDAIAE